MKKKKMLNAGIFLGGVLLRFLKLCMMIRSIEVSTVKHGLLTLVHFKVREE